jgi:hypothetical protein
MNCPEAPGLPGHVVVIDVPPRSAHGARGGSAGDQSPEGRADHHPEPQGFGVFCIPHGRIASEDTHLAAFLAACEHDNEVAPWALKGWL